MLPDRRRRSLATRVTLIATTATAVVMGLLLAGLFVAVTGQLETATQSGLQARSRDLQAALDTGGPTGLRAEPFAQLGEGADVRLSPALGDTTLVPAGTGAGTFDRDVRRPGSEDEKLRVLARRLPDGQLLAVGVSRRPQEDAGERLLVSLAIAGPVLLLLVALVVARSVQAALRPVEQLARQARQISDAEDTGRRLPPLAGDDEIAHLSATLDAMLARLAVAFERERAFVDDASHELRTPLAVLRGELELALADLEDRPAVEQSLRAALAEAERLTRLADDLLLLARERAGGLDLRHEDVDLRALLERTAGRLAPTTGLDLAVDCPPLHLTGDADRLEQVLTNLIVNASAAGARRAVLRGERVPGGVRVKVEDDGPGFPPGFAEVAFGRFTRADTARTRASGAGLGLALVAAIMHAAGGTVSAGGDSALGGAAVRLDLPDGRP